jgi:hypothetical protein
VAVIDSDIDECHDTSCAIEEGSMPRVLKEPVTTFEFIGMILAT